MNKRHSLKKGIILLVLLSCNKNQKENKSVTTSADSISIIDYNTHKYSMEVSKHQLKSEYDNSKIKKIDSKEEARSDGNFNQMTLFEVDKDISSEQLKDYCLTAKPEYNNGYFQILVFFKKPNSARFPDNPLTGMYIEESDLKNIKATYTINNINGYSKLDYYENNNWESLVQTIDIN
ncbi:hypothetical protein [Chryseobacterium sp. JUb7]|uniref:hypothetical protein n=1 Tax=Chryseobacterium sp. JUb7 TaxID=2940599 RepID=UPI002169F3A4|nr:hypothetical protein [Chryseobacterium sp. JUb7]MCS3531859.1 hypothetical protein [Chryseobacterium sp. JUb7]